MLTCRVHGVEDELRQPCLDIGHDTKDPFSVGSDFPLVSVSFGAMSVNLPVRGPRDALELLLMDLEQLIETHRRMDEKIQIPARLPGQLDDTGLQELPKEIIDFPHAVNSPLTLADGAEPKPPTPTVSLQPVIPEVSSSDPMREFNGMFSKLGTLAMTELKQKRSILNLHGEVIQDNALERVVHSAAYQALSVLLIVSNAIFIGAQTQTAAMAAAQLAQRDPPQRMPEQTGFTVVANIFNVIFAIELLVHWSADGVFGFFVSEERYWNVLDIIIVTTGLIDFVTDTRLISPLLFNFFEVLNKDFNENKV